MSSRAGGLATRPSTRGVPGRPTGVTTRRPFAAEQCQAFEIAQSIGSRSHTECLRRGDIVCGEGSRRILPAAPCLGAERGGRVDQYSGQAMSVFNLTFWILVVFIAVLVFAIETGIAARHRKIVLSSIATSLISALVLMLMVEDKTIFDFGEPGPRKAKKSGRKAVVVVQNDGEGGPLTRQPDVTVISRDSEQDGESAEVYDGPDPNGFQDCPACPMMVLVKAGEISIGSTTMEPGRSIGEDPIKDIKLETAFAVGKNEVLRGEYERFVTITGYRTRGVCRVRIKRKDFTFTWDKPGFAQTERHPVVCVNYHDAKAYVQWLARTTKMKYRLLSQAEWEYVARGGSIQPYWNGMTVTREHANFGNLFAGTTPSGQFPDNPFKLRDVHGNVWEMTADCWSPDLNLVHENGAPVGTVGDCSRHVIKGGGWDSPLEKLRSATRGVIAKDDAKRSVGFRVMREIAKDEKLLTLLSKAEGGTKPDPNAVEETAVPPNPLFGPVQ